MISQELFVKAINFIKTQEEKEGNLYQASALDDYADILINVLAEAMNIQQDSDIIYWWLWDTDGGRTARVYEASKNNEDIEEIILSTPEALYNYIVKYVDEKDNRLDEN